MSEIIKRIRRDLASRGEEKVRKSGQRFFKEPIRMHGVATPVARKIGKEFFREIGDSGKRTILDLCEELWESGYIEESFIACAWSYYIRKEYAPGDMKVFEKWVRLYVGNWASCDTLCNHSVGTLLDMYPECVPNLKKWAKSKNRWMRRASAVSLIVPARRGKFLGDIFEIADILLSDPDDLVQKGYGWMLKSAGAAHRKDVFEYVLARKATMPRTALRYAVEKMPGEMRLRAMKG